ncbi:hypothetical protein IWQ60_001105 [Tieghemiomyces parasiticus]|uniref:RING-type domain-containing protein n=1 Tax=Tieghemiomyces parasiticus TaxID=78921 RepID=A0A9W8AEK7_9FUNG|nr:hypothetical protein IWQ60_001105 [Tieghemiomyces parasiticus]
MTFRGTRITLVFAVLLALTISTVASAPATPAGDPRSRSSALNVRTPKPAVYWSHTARPPTPHGFKKGLTRRAVVAPATLAHLLRRGNDGTDFHSQNTSNSTAFLDNASPVATQTLSIILGVCLGFLGLVALCLMGRCVRSLRRRHQREQARLERRQQGIDTFASAAERDEYGALDPFLLQFLDEIDTKQQDITTLDQPTLDPKYRPGGWGHAEKAAAPSTADGDSSMDLSATAQGNPRSLADIAHARSLVLTSQNASRSAKSTPGKTTTGSTSQDGCVICLDTIDRGQKARQLPCKHLFHLDCIDEWLVEKMSVCPLCKFDCAAYCMDKAGPEYKQRLRELRARQTPELLPESILGLM